MTEHILLNDLRRHAAATYPLTRDAISRVIERGHFLLGPELADFENEYAAYCGVAHCVGVANGTDALEIGLRAIGVGNGSKVATVANAGSYTTTALHANRSQQFASCIRAGAD